MSGNDSGKTLTSWTDKERVCILQAARRFVTRRLTRHVAHIPLRAHRELQHQVRLPRS
jgi:hypothetical protein